ncbi:hypothetical protein BGZ61DRAFT_471982 [Ilyonectria robusta]|uniref:uncharacterized protein n=1 Tax=Ilyonectria robusta TaxID=1079257 RepID=UPI001E8D3AE9|nr:uncharacterized protein BGZ61DRAFT_471982 [Ilyonectria robusta]KAH8735565.1 hypothetical protein BGZ61DRAFT_471982 [Ilyonectria robusta]
MVELPPTLASLLRDPAPGFFVPGHLMPWALIHRETNDKILKEQSREESRTHKASAKGRLRRCVDTIHNRRGAENISGVRIGRHGVVSARMLEAQSLPAPAGQTETADVPKEQEPTQGARVQNCKAPTRINQPTPHGQNPGLLQPTVTACRQAITGPSYILQTACKMQNTCFFILAGRRPAAEAPVPPF